MKNPYFAARPDAVADPDNQSVDEILTQTGMNTGNLMFFSAARRVIKHELSSSGVGFNPAYVRANHDGVVIPAANWLTSRRDLGDLANLIEKADVPTVVLGLGAQSFVDDVPEMPEGTKRFLKALSERSHSLSARGAFTAEVIEKAGVKNVTVTGCPSLLWKLTGPPQVAKRSGPITKVSVNGTRYDEKNMFNGQTKSEIGLIMMRLAKAHGYHYVAQTERLEMQFARGELTSSDKPELAYLGKVYGETELGEMRNYLARKLKFFTNVPDWVDYLKTREMTLGTRLHGVISGLLAGIPGVLVTHDSRTKEMAVQAGIPHISAKSVMEGGEIDVQQLYEAADIDHFNKVQQKYYANFVEFFRGNNIETNLAPV